MDGGVSAALPVQRHFSTLGVSSSPQCKRSRVALPTSTLCASPLPDSSGRRTKVTPRPACLLYPASSISGSRVHVESAHLSEASVDRLVVLPPLVFPPAKSYRNLCCLFASRPTHFVFLSVLTTWVELQTTVNCYMDSSKDPRGLKDTPPGLRQVFPHTSKMR